MDRDESANLVDAIEKMHRYAYARNRASDPVPRTISLTDDEAAAVLFALKIVGGE